MYRIAVEDYFDAAHALRGYKGKCEAIHGHRFKVVARVKTDKLDDIGLAYDFTELKARLKAILDRFDHTLVNDMPPFDEINPSSENMARTIHDELKAALQDAPVVLEAVEVWESPTSCAEYRKG